MEEVKPNTNILLVDKAVAGWIEENRKKDNKEQDKRKTRQRPYHYDNIVLLWHYLSTQETRELKGREGEWVKTPLKVLDKLGLDHSKARALKQEMKAAGLAEWHETKRASLQQHYMKPLYTDELVEYELTFKDSRQLLAGFTEDERACEILRRHMNNSISIDKDKAVEFLDEQRQKEKEWLEDEANTPDEIELIIPSDRKEWKQWNKYRKKDKGLYLKWWLEKEKTNYNRNRMLVDAIYNSTGTITRDNKGRRLHSPFTTLDRRLRRFITIEGEATETLDISHFHPTLIANEIIRAGSKDDGLLDDCLNNNFYNKIAIEVEAGGEILGDGRLPPYYDDVRVSPRDRAKDAVMSYLNGEGSSRPTNPERRAVRIAMLKHYPNVERYISAQKEELAKEVKQINKTNTQQRTTVGKLYSQKLQRMESNLYIDTFYQTLAGTEDIPSFTIHDSITVAKSQRQKARTIMARLAHQQELRAADDDGEL